MKNIVLLTLLVVGSHWSSAQELEVQYKMIKAEWMKGKIAVSTNIKMMLSGEVFSASPLKGNFRHWVIKGESFVADAYFKSAPSKGIWWEIVEDDQITTALLAEDVEDTNDPRAYTIRSTHFRSIYRVLNEEPDCNSEFVLLEAAESPTLLTGVARMQANITNTKPCGKGKWELSSEHKTPERVMLAFIFSAIQSMNVRMLDKLQ